MSKILYEYMVVLCPTPDESAAGVPPRLITPAPKYAFGSTPNAIFLMASREVPQVINDSANPGTPITIDPDRVKIIVRPFECGESTVPEETLLMNETFISLPGKESFSMSLVEAYSINPTELR